MGQQVVEHLQHLLHREAVVPPQHQLQLQSHRLGQEQRLAGFDQIRAARRWRSVAASASSSATK
jgi:hypothetical protein